MLKQYIVYTAEGDWGTPAGVSELALTAQALTEPAKLYLTVRPCAAIPDVT